LTEDENDFLPDPGCCAGADYELYRSKFFGLLAGGTDDRVADQYVRRQLAIVREYAEKKSAPVRKYGDK
jgi:hypothetical protein